MLYYKQYDEGNPQALSRQVVDDSFLSNLREAVTHLILKVPISTDFFLKCIYTLWHYKRDVAVRNHNSSAVDWKKI